MGPTPSFSIILPRKNQDNVNFRTPALLTGKLKISHIDENIVVQIFGAKSMQKIETRYTTTIPDSKSQSGEGSEGRKGSGNVKMVGGSTSKSSIGEDFML